MPSVTDRPHTLAVPADLFSRLPRIAEDRGTDPDQLALNALSATVAEPTNPARSAPPQDQRDRLAHARALIARWQQADNTPTAAPAPNDAAVTPSEALFKQWEREDEQLTEAQRGSRVLWWEQFQQGVNAERAASGMTPIRTRAE